MIDKFEASPVETTTRGDSVPTTIDASVLESRVKRRETRREFFRAMGGAAAGFAGAVALTSNGQPVYAQDNEGPTDAEILNFALNLEYLEAQFYFYATFGRGLPNDILTGQGRQGPVVGGRKVNFTDRKVELYAREIAVDERRHVEFLRTALGNAAVAQPPINIGAGPNGAFTAAARAAGLIPADGTFDPYASDENFLLGAFIFEDVGVTAYKGAAPLIDSPVFLEAAAGILAVEAYHAAIIRTTLFGKGFMDNQMLIDATEAISDARDSLDDPTDKDQGVAPRQGDFGQFQARVSNIAPLDENGLAFSRPADDVLNIVYLTQEAATQGGFFPQGVNGAIKQSSPF